MTTLSLPTLINTKTLNDKRYVLWMKGENNYEIDITEGWGRTTVQLPGKTEEYVTGVFDMLGEVIA